MSVSSNSMARFLNFALKNRKNRMFNPIGIGNEGAGLVAVPVCPKFVSNLNNWSSNFQVVLYISSSEVNKVYFRSGEATNEIHISHFMYEIYAIYSYSRQNN